ncbi:hypothetical protein HPE56_14595 [Maribacter sp. ANRC-HE7]|uniref:Por secretion system C-terminal sorting domain-containing protein n=1 Tax=Maribacter aquimaris TaxID=2737171 RepID=A0ABR7V707_9FLAO|nr:hypothetical protein [Maribacter aquimaris]MBD0779027.1 hypothetical protein [Maribacter aquimaris]
MKAIKKITLSAAFLLITAFGMANEMDLRIISNNEDKSLVFRYENLTTDASLRFIDGQGNVIFSENLKDKSAYLKRFNLNSLSTGTYFLTVEDAIKETEYTIAIEDANISIENKSEKNKPVFRTIEDMVYVNYLNLEKAEVEIKVYDESDRVVFNEVINRDDIIERAFNFKQAYKGIYIIKVKKNDETYYEEINVD